MFPMNRKPVAIGVEYTSKGKRVVKRFDDAYKAKWFYTAKFHIGANPKVVAVEEKSDVRYDERRG